MKKSRLLTETAKGFEFLSEIVHPQKSLFSCLTKFWMPLEKSLWFFTLNKILRGRNPCISPHFPIHGDRESVPKDFDLKIVLS